MPEAKSGWAGSFVALHMQADASWTRRDYAALAREGFMRNPIVHRAVRLIAETASAAPWLLYEGEAELTEHPLLALLERPTPARPARAFSRRSTGTC
jgi:phage portal protein BeeE